jgi:competence protein ComEC
MSRESRGRVWKWVNWGLVLVMGLLGLVAWQRSDEKLRLVFCDVGQGDATLMSWKNYQVLVDGGPNEAVLECLGKNLPFWDRKIEVVALTHPQADHMTGLIEVVKRYEVGEMMAPWVVNETPEFWELRRRVMEKGIKVKELVKGDELRVGGMRLKVLWPETRGGNELAWGGGSEAEVLGASYPGDVNEVSLVLEGSFGKFDWLLTGDVSEKEEGLMEVDEVEVLKVAHHGSRYSTSEGFLEKVKPELAVISVGERNRFGHPTATVLERLVETGAKVLRTDEEGTVVIASDDQRWWQE